MDNDADDIDVSEKNSIVSARQNDQTIIPFVSEVVVLESKDWDSDGALSIVSFEGHNYLTGVVKLGNVVDLIWMLPVERFMRRRMLVLVSLPRGPLLTVPIHECSFFGTIEV